MSVMVAEKPLLQERECKERLFTVYKVIVRPYTETDGCYAICDTPDGGCVTQAMILQEADVFRRKYFTGQWSEG